MYIEAHKHHELKAQGDLNILFAFKTHDLVLFNRKFSFLMYIYIFWKWHSLNVNIQFPPTYSLLM